MTKESPDSGTPPNGEALPSYAAATSSAVPDESPNDIDVTASFANLSLSPSPPTGVPTVDTCLAHLKLLHAIDSLKEDVGYADGLFGIWDNRAKWDTEILQGAALPPGVKLDSLGEGEKTKLGLSRLREKRWAIYLARAVDRYEAWWNAMTKDKTMLTEQDMATPKNPRYIDFPTSGAPLPWKDELLPPLGRYLIYTL